MKRILEDEAYSEIDALHARQKIYQHIIKLRIDFILELIEFSFPQ